MRSGHLRAVLVAGALAAVALSGCGSDAEPVAPTPPPPTATEVASPEAPPSTEPPTTSEAPTTAGDRASTPPVGEQLATPDPPGADSSTTTPPAVSQEELDVAAAEEVYREFWEVYNKLRTEGLHSDPAEVEHYTDLLVGPMHEELGDHVVVNLLTCEDHTGVTNYQYEVDQEIDGVVALMRSRFQIDATTPERVPRFLERTVLTTGSCEG